MTSLPMRWMTAVAAVVALAGCATGDDVTRVDDTGAIWIGWTDWTSMRIESPAVMDGDVLAVFDRRGLEAALHEVGGPRQRVEVLFRKAVVDDRDLGEIEAYFHRLGFADVAINPDSNPLVGRDNNGDGGSEGFFGDTSDFFDSDGGDR